MKLTTLLFIVSLFQLHATGSYGQKTKISLNLENITVEKVLDEIELNTEFKFLYDYSHFNFSKKVSVNVKDERISSVLDKLFKNSNIIFKVINKQIILKHEVVTNSNENDNFQQRSIEISGTVKDFNGEPLPGANIIEKGRGNGTQSDFDGNFSLNVIDKNSVIVVSFMGFVSKEIIVGNKTSFSIILKEDAATLDEIVLIGYGSVAKKDVTGAISAISSNSYKNQPVTRIDQAIQGRAPGVQASQTSGAPGEGLKIRIRGANSISSNNAPLYIVDGLAVSSINSINVNDIKSLAVLKDASATAIYGSRGANGVVLISTKNGRKDELQVTYQTFSGISSLPNKLPVMNGANFAEGVNDAEDPVVIYSQAEIDALKSSGGEDWQDRIFKNGFFTSHDLSLSGGNDKTDFFASANYNSDDGIAIGRDFKRYSSRVKLNSQLSKKLKGGVNLYVTRSELDGPGVNIGEALVFDPSTSAFDNNGEYNQYSIKGVASGTPNPLIYPENVISETFNNQLITTSYFNYQITDDLVLNVSGGIDVVNTIKNTYIPIFVNGKGSATVFNQEVFRFQNTNRLTYTKEINEDHKIKIDAIFEQLKDDTEYTTAFGEDFFSDANTYKQLEIATIKNNNHDSFDSSLLSYATRINYTLFDKLSITATFRADGSSKFREGNRWGYFPSGAVAYNMSDENFIKNSKVFNNLKVRAGYGITGNQGVNARSTYSRARLGLDFNYPFTGNDLSVGFAPSLRIDNKDLTWESTAQLNAGVDVGLFDSRFQFSFDYYKKNTTDLLLDTSLPKFVGANIITINAGEIENKGFDISLGGTIVDKDDFKINSSLTFSSNKNKVLSLVDDTPIEKGKQYVLSTFAVNPTRVEVGQPISSFRGYVFEGVYQLGEEAEAASFGRNVGDAKYKDITGDGNITTDDITTIGNGNPDFTWGLNTDITYKKFNLNVLILGSEGNDVYNFTRGGLMGLGARVFHAVHQDWENRWTPTNPSNIPSGRDGTELLSSQFLEDGSFVRVKNVGLSYTMDTVKFVKSLSLSLNAENLFLFTKYKGFDPEASATGASDVDLGIDFNAYPMAKTITFGLTATF